MLIKRTSMLGHEEVITSIYKTIARKYLLIHAQFQRRLF